MNTEEAKKLREKLAKLHLHLRRPEELKYAENEKIGGFWENGVLIMPLVINDIVMANANMRQMLVLQDRIVITTDFAKDLASPRRHRFIPLVWHEFGHHKLKHLGKFKSQKEIQQDRLNAIMAGTVCQSEKEADAFAARHVGIPRMVAALKNMRQERYEHDVANNCANEPYSILAIKELDYRIEALLKTK